MSDLYARFQQASENWANGVRASADAWRAAIGTLIEREWQEFVDALPETDDPRG